MANIDIIMLMAAGKGTRMGELTSSLPKSLLKIHGKPILYYVLELCKKYPFKRIVINTHHFAEKIEEAIKIFQEQNPDFPEIVTIYEPELLETGGGIKNAAGILGETPIFKMNTDVIIESSENIFAHMQKSWDPVKMDFLLLLQRYEDAYGYKKNGDFGLDGEGKISRFSATENYPYMFTGIEILKPSLIKSDSRKVFSLRDYYCDKDNAKVYGKITNDAKWYHATNPEDLGEIEHRLKIDK